MLFDREILFLNMNWSSARRDRSILDALDRTSSRLGPSTTAE